jgi:hypothetical protein
MAGRHRARNHLRAGKYIIPAIDRHSSDRPTLATHARVTGCGNDAGIMTSAAQRRRPTHSRLHRTTQRRLAWPQALRYHFYENSKCKVFPDNSIRLASGTGDRGSKGRHRKSSAARRCRTAAITDIMRSGNVSQAR